MHFNGVGFVCRLAAVVVSVGSLAACLPGYTSGGQDAAPQDAANAGLADATGASDARPDSTVQNAGDAAVDATFEAGADSGALWNEAGSEAGECAAAELACASGCVADDVHNCGTCGHDCTDLYKVVGSVSCDAGACVLGPDACQAGFAHCSGSTDEGCETSITTQSHCGACGNACAADSGMAVCASNGSAYACASGCSTDTPTLCGTGCTNTLTDTQNCGTCSTTCATSVMNAVASCSGGACGFTCTTSYPNACNGGCVNFQTDGANCGSCGNTCTGGKVCVSGECACTGATHLCGATCVSNSDANNCGSACATNCLGPTAGTGSPSCNGSSCAIACSGSESLCGTACVDTSSDTGNCGSCGHSCLWGGCSGGECQPWVVCTPSVTPYEAPSTDGNYVAFAVAPYDADAAAPFALYQCPVSGGTAPQLVTNNYTTSVFALNGKIVWLESDGTLSWTAIGFMTEGSTTATTSAHQSGAPLPFVGLDPAAQHLYLPTYESGDLNSCSPLSGALSCTPFVTGLPLNLGPVAFGFGASSGVMIAGTGGSSQGHMATGVSLVTLPQGGVTNLSGQGPAAVAAVAADNQNVYWLNEPDYPHPSPANVAMTLMAAPVGNPSGAAAIVPSITFGEPDLSLESLASDGTNVYLAGPSPTPGSMPTAAGSFIATVPATGGTPTTIYSSQNQISGIAYAKNAIYWTEGSSIWGMATP